MGKGDRKTKKGKIRLGSYGKIRSRKNPNTNLPQKATAKEVSDSSSKKAASKKKTRKKA